MPLEVRELVIRARVGTGDSSSTQPESRSGDQGQSISQAEAVREAIAQMSEINRNRKER